MNTPLPLLLRAGFPLALLGGLAGCANQLKTRIHVYNPVARHDELKQIVATGKETPEQKRLFEQLGKLLPKPTAETYNRAWHERIATVIESHRTVADDLAATARRIVERQILAGPRTAAEARLKTVEPALETAKGKMEAAEAELKTAEREAQVSTNTTGPTPESRMTPEAARAAREKIAAKDAVLREAKKAHAELVVRKNEIETNQRNLETRMAQTLDRYAAALAGVVAEAGRKFDDAYAASLADPSPQRGDVLAFNTRQLLENFLKKFWAASNYPLDASGSPATGAGRISAFDFAPEGWSLELPAGLRNFYDRDRGTQASLARLVASASRDLADKATPPATGRDGIVRNEVFEESVTHPLVILARRDPEGWNRDVATATMESNVKSAVVVVRDTPSSYAIISYDGDAGTTVSEGLRATTNTALIALEAARMITGAPVPLPAPKADPNDPTAKPTAPPPAIPTETFRAVARDRLKQVDALLNEPPAASDTAREHWGKKVRELISSTPFLPSK